MLLLVSEVLAPRPEGPPAEFRLVLGPPHELLWRAARKLNSFKFLSEFPPPWHQLLLLFTHSSASHYVRNRHDPPDKALKVSSNPNTALVHNRVLRHLALDSLLRSWIQVVTLTSPFYNRDSSSRKYCVNLGKSRCKEQEQANGSCSHGSPRTSLCPMIMHSATRILRRVTGTITMLCVR